MLLSMFKFFCTAPVEPKHRLHLDFSPTCAEDLSPLHPTLQLQRCLEHFGFNLSKMGNGRTLWGSFTGHSSLRFLGRELPALCGFLCSHHVPAAPPGAAGKRPKFSKEIFGFHLGLAVKLCVFFQRQAGFKMEGGDNVMIKRLEPFQGSF